MKRLPAALLCGLLSLAILSGCKKDDKPAAKDCQVEQFESTRNLNYNGTFGPVPYLFRKSFDQNGKVSTIDAFVYSLSGGFRQQARLEYKTQMVYALEQNSSDTVMVIWLNSAGRVTKAVEKSAFNNPNPASLMTYEFTYSSDNKLQVYTALTSNQYPQLYTSLVQYDANGNCTRLGNTYFTYDLTKTAKKQFYFDSEALGNFFLGVKFLEYLNYFPEVNSPINIRTNTRVEANPTANLANTALTDHQLDSDGKLISYKAAGQLIPVFWKCDYASPKQ